MSKRVALVTGISGQDGAYLARLLLEKGYRVVGARRPGAVSPLWRLDELGVGGEVELVTLDLSDAGGLVRALERIQPDEIYNFAAQSFVAASFDGPADSGEASGLTVARLLEAVRTAVPTARFYQASSSEMFGRAQDVPQRETTPFHPRTPYGAAKLYAHWITVYYREAHGIFACSGILYNHESPLRGTEYVTRKITATLADQRAGRAVTLELGNLSAERDWGFAGDYVDGVWRMLQQRGPSDYVLATGRRHTVRDFVRWSAAGMGIELEFAGEGLDEVGRDARTGAVLLRVHPRHFRPAEVVALVGDSSKARRELGWAPQVDVQQLAAMMAEADVRRAALGPVLHA